jgi:hypothetical protein
VLVEIRANRVHQSLERRGIHGDNVPVFDKMKEAEEKNALYENSCPMIDYYENNTLIKR